MSGSVFKFLLFIRTLVILDEGPPKGLVLTWLLMYKDCLQILSHFEVWELGLQQEAIWVRVGRGWTVQVITAVKLRSHSFFLLIQQLPQPCLIKIWFICSLDREGHTFYSQKYQLLCSLIPALLAGKLKPFLIWRQFCLRLFFREFLKHLSSPL